MLESKDRFLGAELVIVGPDFLEEGQNFFMQEPFQGILSRATNRIGIQSSLLACLITIVTGDEIQDMTEGEKWLKVKDTLKIGPNKIAKLIRSWPDIYKELNNYPLWQEYIKDQRDTTSYKPDGGYMKVRTNEKIDRGQTPTYGKWLADTTERQHNLTLVGIHEVFLQDLRGTNIQEAVTAATGGKRKIRRHWIIRSAANIIPEKR